MLKLNNQATLSGSVIIGEPVTLSTTIAATDPATGAATPEGDAGVKLYVRSPSNVETIYTATSTPPVIQPDIGNAYLELLPDELGDWYWRWLEDASTQDASEGSFTVVSAYEGGVTDQRDLRVLIPACRRAIDGPLATTPSAPSTTLGDQEVLNLLADSTAMLILQCEGHQAFGYQLEVTQRDPFYLAPVAWQTDNIRYPAADAAILSQAALDHYFWLIKLLKVSETMKNEAVSWEYSLSANVISAWMAYLIANRDKAIAALQVIHAPLDAYISMVAERDRLAAAWLEPWVTEVGAPVPYVGGGGSGPLEYDYRFSTWG